MAITRGYATLAEVKAACRIPNSDTGEDAMIEKVIESASRRIDGYCGRFFYQVANTTIRFYPIDEYRATFPDIASSNITVATDDEGDGTYSDTWAATDYLLNPTDAVLQSRPYTSMTAVAGKTFPIFTTPALPSLQITATWGWSAIPDDVQEACILLSMRQYSRYNAPLGVAGFSDMGAITVRSIDPDVRDLLSPYVVVGVA